MTPEITAAEVNFLESVLRAPPGGRLLDVPCGNGRHALALARRGYRLTGVDASAEFLAEARAASPEGEWILGDMCDLPWTAQFDGAYCFGNSFPYLDRAGAARFLAAVAGALKPGGRFVVDTGMAAESILPGLTRNRWLHVGDIYMLSEAQYHVAEARLDIRYTFIRGGEVETRPATSYAFTAAEIRRMHAEVGLETVELLGSAGGDPYQLGSPRLLLVTQKR